MATRQSRWYASMTPNLILDENADLIDHGATNGYHVMTMNTCNQFDCPLFPGLLSSPDEFLSGYGVWDGPNQPFPNDATIVINVPVDNGTTFYINTSDPNIGINHCILIWNVYPVDNNGNYLEDGWITVFRSTDSLLSGVFLAPQANIVDASTGSFAGLLIGRDYTWQSATGTLIQNWDSAITGLSPCSSWEGCAAVYTSQSSSTTTGATSTTTTTSNDTISTSESDCLATTATETTTTTATTINSTTATETATTTDSETTTMTMTETTTDTATTTETETTTTTDSVTLFTCPTGLLVTTTTTTTTTTTATQSVTTVESSTLTTTQTDTTSVFITVPTTVYITATLTDKSTTTTTTTSTENNDASTCPAPSTTTVTSFLTDTITAHIHPQNLVCHSQETRLQLVQ
ncbi:hypothetical protein BC940DRAFT_315873 [Gongronella butleri]|nr:hypothetical protein BC940DRAFT_315873 [Gongronella butleri]